ncbi:MAG: N-acetylornithine carbamoyltransferase [Armatimonadetes bacterium]|nr:N-acetylornithine carbamoyltransferase [Armatimonadota bacterium]
MKSFLHLWDNKPEEIESLLAEAKRLEREPLSDVLKGKVVGLLFMNPSLRTLASFQAGVAQLGGSSFVLQPGSNSWGLEFEDGAVMDGVAAEHVKEAIPVLAEYCDVLGVRCFAKGEDLSEDLVDGVMEKINVLSPRPVVNMESAADHPCQALADWKTLDDTGVPRNGKFVLSWAWHPKPLPYAVPQAALSMAAMRGMDVTVLCPPGFELPDAVMSRSWSLMDKPVRVSHNVDEAMEGAHVLYCKSWTAPSWYGNPEEEAKQRANLRNWCVSEDWFRTAEPSAKFMHCLPVRRNVKVKDEVLDGPRSVVVREAGNRLHVQKAVLSKLVEAASA